MNIIEKYPLPIKDHISLDLPANPEILSIQFQNDVLTLWALVDTDAPLEPLNLAIVTTGLPFPKSSWIHLATVLSPAQQIAYHIFDTP